MVTMLRRYLSAGPRRATARPSYLSRHMMQANALSAYCADPSETNRKAFLASLDL